MIEWIKNNPPIIIAIYGAFLSTIAIVWNIYNNLQDKPKVKVTVKFGFLTFDEKLSEPQLIITVINKGKRSVYLSSMGLRSGKEDLLNLKTIGLPCELKSGSSHSEWFEVNKLKDRLFDFAWYRDQTGKLYKSRNITRKLNNYSKSESSLMQKAFRRESL
jgi:hypothetical protein